MVRLKNVNVSFVGSSLERMGEVAQRLAKKGTESDIEMHDKREGDVALSISIPRTYPERIQPLLQCISMSDAVVLFPEAADSTVGEEIVAISSYARPGAIVADQELGGRLLKMISQRTQGWRLLAPGEGVERDLREYLYSLETKRDVDREHWRVDVDHAFDVKGVGTVCLGIVRYGTARVHDKVVAMPGGGEGLVRSIQIFDVDQKDAPAGSRVGFALKGLSPDDLPRGTIITNDLRYGSARAVSIGLKRENYFRDPFEAGKTIHLCVGLQCKQSKIIDIGESVEVETEEPIAFEEESAVLFSARPPGQLRIAGHGSISRLLA